MKFIATSTLGLEGAVSRELKLMGFRTVYSESGRVWFDGSLEDIPRLNLWMRTAERILMVVGSFELKNYDDLFEGTASLEWERFIEKGGAFPVARVKMAKTDFKSPKTVQRIVKRAIGKRLKAVHGTSEEFGPEYPVHVYLRRSRVTLAVDTTGRAGLHKRGYRIKYSTAPLRETVAASVLVLARYDPATPLVDPFCGSGTIPIEAAMIARSIAPGLKRDFVSTRWKIIGEDLWDMEKKRALDSMIDATPDIICSDIDPEVLDVARENASRAGVRFEIVVSDFKNLRVPWRFGKVITNPPYGERLSDRTDLWKIPRIFPGWEYHIISPRIDLGGVFGGKTRKKIPFFNSGIKVFLHQFF